jgi:2'-5' RNA ligase
VFVNKQSVGATFKDWPLHVTIVPWFRLITPSSELASELREHYVGSKPFKINVLQEAQFGYKKKKVVNIVDASELRRLEGQTRRLLHSHKAWIVDEADKTRNFHPHVTAQKTERVHDGDSFNCSCLYIVSQHGGFKHIDCEVNFVCKGTKVRND